MKVYYSIFFYRGSSYGDRINVGLLMFNQSGTISKISDDRMKAVNIFSRNKGFLLFKKATESVNQTFNNWIKPTKQQITDLHHNSNNLFGIDKPMLIDIDFTQENFDKLFDKILK